MEYKADSWHEYKMDWQGDPHPVMESPEKEIEVVDDALRVLANLGFLPLADYDHEKFLAHRRAVKELFEIPWTGISPRMQRLLYGINAACRPRVMVAMGIFCGNTFISNAGAAIGPGKCYDAWKLVGIEIIPKETERARRNVATVDETGIAEILTTDGAEWLKDSTEKIDLLYIDANGSYLPIIREAAERHLISGALILAHNSINQASSLADYLRFVRDPGNSMRSINMCIDDQGLEVTRWK